MFIFCEHVCAFLTQLELILWNIDSSGKDKQKYHQNHFWKLTNLLIMNYWYSLQTRFFFNLTNIWGKLLSFKRSKPKSSCNTIISYSWLKWLSSNSDFDILAVGYDKYIWAEKSIIFPKCCPLKAWSDGHLDITDALNIHQIQIQFVF